MEIVLEETVCALSRRTEGDGERGKDVSLERRRGEGNRLN